MKDTVKYPLTAVVIAIVIIVFLGFLLSYPMMLLWNGCLVPATTIIKEVNWLQMWGIMVLLGILFRSRGQSNK